MTRHTGISLAGLVVAALVLPGCSDIRSMAGFDRTVPDEFAVVSRAPLTLPPSFDLPPPNPGAPRPQEGRADDQAETALFGRRQSGFFFDGQYTPAGPASPGETALLASSGGGSAQANIRQTVNREADQEIEDSKGIADGLLFWQTPEQLGQVVEPVGEMRRLANNAALGLPLNEGEVPVIVPREKAPLEGLFGN